MNKRHNHFALMILTLTISICMGVLYVYMNYAVEASVGRTILASDIAAVELTDKSQEKDLEKLYMDTADDRARLRAFFVSDTEIIPFVESLEALGPITKSELKLSSLESDDTGNLKPGSLSSLRAHVEAKGPWSSVMRVLKLSETLPYDISIGEVRLTASEVEKSKVKQWMVSYDIKVTMMKK